MLQYRSALDRKLFQRHSYRSYNYTKVKSLQQVMMVYLLQQLTTGGHLHMLKVLAQTTQTKLKLVFYLVSITENNLFQVKDHFIMCNSIHIQ